MSGTYNDRGEWIGEARDEPAFPVGAFTRLDNTGLTKREWMAATILAGLLQDALFGSNEWRCSQAVILADALLERLAK